MSDYGQVGKDGQDKSQQYDGKRERERRRRRIKRRQGEMRRTVENSGEPGVVRGPEPGRHQTCESRLAPGAGEIDVGSANPEAWIATSRELISRSHAARA